MTKQKQYLQEKLQNQSNFEIQEAIKHKGIEYLFYPIFIDKIKEILTPYLEYDIEGMKQSLSEVSKELENIEFTLKELNKLHQLFNLVKSDNPIKPTNISKIRREHNQFLITLLNSFYSKNIEIIQFNIRELRDQYQDYKTILKSIKRDLKVSLYEFKLDVTTEAIPPTQPVALTEEHLQQAMLDMINAGNIPVNLFDSTSNTNNELIIYAGQDLYDK